MNDFSPFLFSLVLAALWSGFGLFGVLRMIKRSARMRERFRQFRRAGVSTKAALVAGLVCAVAIGGTKPGGGTNDPPRGLRSWPAADPVASAFAPVEVRTNGVALRAESASAVEVGAWRRHGASEDGVWLDLDEPFFRIGTNPVSRVHVAASGALSFESTRRPPVGAPLPDGTGLPALAPLLAPLGMVPEANWTNAGACSRFWHDAAPGGGRVLTWEDALIDRLPGRRVTVQAELLPAGGFIFRYDFSDALDPPATNFVMGAQIGTNGVNALAILGTDVLSAPVWRVDGEARPQGSPASLADLLCTNGALRTPARFAVEWSETPTGEALLADSDGDGLSDGDEIFLHGTSPVFADTDGDGVSDGAEILEDADPLDADEDGDGVPDGADPVAWAAHPLRASDVSEADFTVVLDENLPAGVRATLLLGDLALPLSTATNWPIRLEPGVMLHARLFSTGENPVPLRIVVPDNGDRPLLRGGTETPIPERIPLWIRDLAGVFIGNATEGEADIARPLLRFRFPDGSTVPLEECLHGGETFRDYRLVVLPEGTGLDPDRAELFGLTRMGDGLVRLSLFSSEPNAWTAGMARLTEGLDPPGITAVVSIHRCAATGGFWCHACGVRHASAADCPHDPGCPAQTQENGTCACPPETVRVGHAGFLRLLGTNACCCPPDVVSARFVSASSNLAVCGASGALAPGDDASGPLQVQALRLSGSAPDEIRFDRISVSEEEDGTVRTNVTRLVRRVWVIDVVHEPITCEGAATNLVNPCGIIRNREATFRLRLWPEAFPDEGIKWIAQPSNAAHPTDGGTGRVVQVVGDRLGDVVLTAAIDRYSGPAPQFEARVVESNLVHVLAYVVTSNGIAATTAERVRSMIPGVNDVFRQVGIAFALDSIEFFESPGHMVIRKGDGFYSDGTTLCNHAQNTGNSEWYFVQEIEAASGLNGPGGMILDTNATARTAAHEAGHACGLADIYHSQTWTNGAVSHTASVEDVEVSRQRLPHDWGTASEEGYYSDDMEDLSWFISRLLMYGIEVPSDHEGTMRADIPYGDVYGLRHFLFEPAYRPAMVPVGFFTNTNPTHLPVHE